MCLHTQLHEYSLRKIILIRLSSTLLCTAIHPDALMHSPMWKASAVMSPNCIFVDMLTLSLRVFDRRNGLSVGSVIKNDIFNAQGPRQLGDFPHSVES